VKIIDSKLVDFAISTPVHILELKSKTHRIFDNLESIAIADPVPNMPGKVAVAISTGVHILDLATGQKQLLAHPETRVGYCYNDGSFDSRGRFAPLGGKIFLTVAIKC
jgi:sugar lactone lactonase YvrE